MKVSIEGQGHFLALFFYRFCMLCVFTRPRYRVSVYRTIGPLVYNIYLLFWLFIYLRSEGRTLVLIAPVLCHCFPVTIAVYRVYVMLFLKFLLTRVKLPYSPHQHFFLYCVVANIMVTCAYNLQPLSPLFHIVVVKLGFTYVYIIFLFFVLKHRLWVLVRF